CRQDPGVAAERIVALSLRAEAFGVDDALQLGVAGAARRQEEIEILEREAAGVALTAEVPCAIEEHDRVARDARVERQLEITPRRGAGRPSPGRRPGHRTYAARRAGPAPSRRGRPGTRRGPAAAARTPRRARTPARPRAPGRARPRAPRADLPAGRGGSAGRPSGSRTSGAGRRSRRPAPKAPGRRGTARTRPRRTTPASPAGPTRRLARARSRIHRRRRHRPPRTATSGGRDPRLKSIPS